MLKTHDAQKYPEQDLFLVLLHNKREPKNQYISFSYVNLSCFNEIPLIWTPQSISLCQTFFLF